MSSKQKSKSADNNKADIEQEIKNLLNKYGHDDFLICFPELREDEIQVRLLARGKPYWLCSTAISASQRVIMSIQKELLELSALDPTAPEHTKTIEGVALKVMSAFADLSAFAEEQLGQFAGKDND